MDSLTIYNALLASKVLSGLNLKPFFLQSFAQKKKLHLFGYVVWPNDQLSASQHLFPANPNDSSPWLAASRSPFFHRSLFTHQSSVSATVFSACVFCSFHFLHTLHIYSLLFLCSVISSSFTYHRSVSLPSMIESHIPNFH